MASDYPVTLVSYKDPYARLPSEHHDTIIYRTRESANSRQHRTERIFVGAESIQTTTDEHSRTQETRDCPSLSTPVQQDVTRSTFDPLSPHPVQTIKVAGHVMHVHPHADAVSDHLRRYGFWEPLESQIALQEVHPGNVVVDVGANIGYYTLLFARLVGNHGMVFAFEPDPENFALLQQNVERNGYRNVTLVQKAVSDRNGRLHLFLDDVNRGDHRIYGPFDHPDIVSVESVRLDDYFANFDRQIDFVKLDIQGAEPAAVAGMETIIHHHRELLLLTEFWPYGLQKFGARPVDYLKLLLDHGFMLYQADERTQAVEPAEVRRLLQIQGQDYVNLVCSRRAWQQERYRISALGRLEVLAPSMAVLALLDLSTNQRETVGDAFYHRQGIASLPAPEGHIVNLPPDIDQLSGCVDKGRLAFRLSGIAEQTHSVLYARAVPGDDQTYIIQAGDYLHYGFLLHEQATLGIDIEFTDGTALRDLQMSYGEPYRDQNGVSIHPAAGAAYEGVEGWRQRTVLIGDGQATGKRIARIGFAYDNGGNGRTGKFDAHFTDARLDRDPADWGKKIPGTALSSYGRRAYSQNDEDGIIECLVHTVRTPSVFAEFGVEDYMQSNTRLLFERGWTGVIMDSDEQAVERARRMFSSPRLRIQHARITRDTINSLLLNGIGLLSIDIDGNDYWVWKAIRQQPTVVIIEYNAQFGPHRKLVVPYDPDFTWQRGSLYFGASLAALSDLAASKGYALVYCNGVNAFFVRCDRMGDLDAQKPQESYVPLTLHQGIPDPYAPVIDLDLVKEVPVASCIG